MDLHYEVELALVMGRKVRDLREDDEEGAMSAIECVSLCFCSWEFESVGPRTENSDG